MNLIKIYKKLIPSFRHKKDLNIFDNKWQYVHNKKNIVNVNYIKRKKFFYKTRPIKLNINIFKFTTLITKHFYYQLKPYKKFIICQTINNFITVIPGIEYLNPGKVLYTHAIISDERNKFFFKGFIININLIPITVIFCNVTNLQNNKITYSKSSGTFCKTKKSKKSKKKLLLIILPSQNEIFLSKMSKAYIGKNTNFRVNEMIEGKWGFSFNVKKKIKVRGVAMNPVDHPNGGRCKTVQPERSPWNWVAKKCK